MRESKRSTWFWLLPLSFFMSSWSGLGQSQDQPAPWTLNGDGYLILSSVSKEENLETGFISDTLKDRYEQSFSVVMLVDYKSSPVGPYKELLYIPGTFRFEDTQSHASISKIFVSSMSSVINGRKNWGIPKELASFAVDSSKKGEETIRVSAQNNEIAKFTLSSLGPKLPISTFFLPKFFKTLGQTLDNKSFVFELKAQGKAQLASLDAASSDPEFFPDLGKGKVLLAVKISDFNLQFPLAKEYQAAP